jgi:hypothetical protein
VKHGLVCVRHQLNVDDGLCSPVAGVRAVTVPTAAIRELNL